MLRLSEVLSLLPAAKRNRARIGGFYSFTWLPITAGAANQQDQITTSASNDFIALRMKTYVTTTANPPVEVTAPQLTMTFVANDQNVMVDNVGIHLGTLASSASERRPYDFAYPLYIERSTTLTAYLTSLYNADLNVRIFLEGIQILNYNSAQG